MGVIGILKNLLHTLRHNCQKLIQHPDTRDQWFCGILSTSRLFLFPEYQFLLGCHPIFLPLINNHDDHQKLGKRSAVLEARKARVILPGAFKGQGKCP